MSSAPRVTEWREKIPAVSLTLLSPYAGIAVDRNGLIYFVDGTVIRRVDQSGVITTVLGSNDLASARPLSCDTVMDIQQVGPGNPISAGQVQQRTGESDTVKKECVTS